MKFTSFEISKKLAEIGFEAETDFFYDERGDFYHTRELEKSKAVIDCMAFDLETLISALPKEIALYDDYAFLYIRHNCVEYSRNYCKDSNINTDALWFSREEGESLADLTGKMLILLREKGLIKFDK